MSLESILFVFSLIIPLFIVNNRFSLFLFFDVFGEKYFTLSKWDWRKSLWTDLRLKGAFYTVFYVLMGFSVEKDNGLDKKAHRLHPLRWKTVN